jgi:hypothetical protein
MKAHSQKHFVEWADTFYASHQVHLGNKVLRQGAKFPYSCLEDLIPLTTALLQRRLFQESYDALSSVPENNHNAISLYQYGISAFYIAKVKTAKCAFEKARELAPSTTNATVGLALVALSEGQDEKASKFAKRALTENRSEPSALGILAHLALYEGDYATFERLMLQRDLSSSVGMPHHSYATGLLSVGEWGKGWDAYRQRETYITPYVFRNHAVPSDISQLADKKVCLVAEQALGDMIQFVRFAALCVDAGAQVHLRCPAKLHRLFHSLPFPIVCHSKVDQPKEFDYVIPLFDLPSYVSWGELAKLNASTYLSAEQEKRVEWHAKIDQTQFNIAIAWQGNPDTAVDIGRSLPLEELSKLLDAPSVKFHCLQLGQAAESAKQLKNGDRLTHYRTLDDGEDAYIDSAAIMQSVDLVITTDTSLAHLAGGIGVPSIVCLKRRPDWRWKFEGDYCDWYPNAHLVRQPEHGNWNAVVAEILAIIAETVKKKETGSLKHHAFT